MTYELGFGPGGGGGGGGSEPVEEACTPSQQFYHYPRVEVVKDETHHTTGFHGGSAQFTTECTITSNCTKYCAVRSIGQHVEDGELKHFFSYHVGKSETTGTIGEGSARANVDCKGAVGVVINECYFPNCDVTFSITIAPGGIGATINSSNSL